MKLEKLYRNEDWLKKKYLEDKLSTREIAKIYGKTKTTINRWLKKFNINIRSTSESMKGNIPWNKGIPRTEKEKQKMSKAKKGKHHSKETREKMSKSHKGEKCYLWKGGVSFEPYTLDWTETLRRSIRERDHYTCQLCGKLQSDVTFDIHHIDGDKENCNPDNLITLCHNCHSKITIKRKRVR